MLAYFKEYFDWKTLVLVLALVGIGLISIFSATHDVNQSQIFYRQLMWGVIGFIGMMIAAMLPIRTLQRLTWVLYGVMLLVLAAILVVGSTVKGSRSWLGVGGIGGQPSEFMKVATILALATFLSRSETTIADFKDLLKTLAIAAIPMVLILGQPDLGTAIVFFATLMPILYWAGVSNFFLIAILVPIIVAFGALFGTVALLVAMLIGGALLYYFRENRFAAAVAFGISLAVGLSVQILFERLPTYQQKRIFIFLNPEADPLGAGYNVVQSKIAIGSGGFLGKGFLHGTQTQLNYIPEQWTDFIFCVTGEEFGFLGGSLVLILFIALILHAMKIASISKNRFGSIGAIGIAGVLVTHVFINAGMSMGIMPVIGIPLPFMSYGGSALVAMMVMAGLLMNFYANRKEH
jgi:rod shape determining protein RodA